ncbi:MAG: SDR family oxidoreductase [Rhodoferax sp.]|uniref:SDR family oxidoreductase n=1 Tax=Rhodoferax sp. TaxID=50421 RepID=UPI0008CFCA26|nr:SDR family oxidoreductase [Rhodoferax sp.]MDP2679133.1 SDR family oxidoreductase [Rhodoferax sp.]OGB50799.1 MAG: NAD(P)-dependent oxidoreductase [Burkholderiales bacterium RIFOXYD12_FULL_59_19]OGB74903.1 MAG: NAD(P)-dependent oxidoreductase [Burkholderiales bacterium RIFOXYC12_FULL_60_6]
MASTLLVTGASGHLGQRVIHHLLETLNVAPQRIIATTRKPETLKDLAAKGITVRSADFDDAASLRSAFAGADRLLLISTDALDRPGRRLEQHQAAVAAAEQAGVAHVVYTSMPLPENSPLLIAPDHAGTEKALASSALEGWTVLRNHWYFENLFMSLPQALASGQWYSAAGQGKVAYIARDDLARAAAIALASEAGGKTSYTLSGAEAFTTEQIAQQVSQATGKPLQVVHVPLAGLIQGMVGAGFPEPLAAVFASFDTNTAAGRVAEVTEDYQKLTGVAQQPFVHWLTANASTLTAQ